MIRRIASDLDTFKGLSFHSGLNILLADKSDGSSDRHSRNGAGKTSFVELVHFLFGADVRKDSIFRSEELVDWTFDAVADIADRHMAVARSGSKASRVLLNGDISGWPIEAKLDQRIGVYEVSNDAWKAALGFLWFGLSPSAVSGAERFQPSFRSLFSYFARRQLSGGFHQPTQHSIKQQPWDQQVSISYLLGLDWTLPARFEELRSQEKMTRQLRTAARAGDLGRFFGKSAEIRTRLTVVEARTNRFREQLRSFQVVPEYKELEREANQITSDIDALNVENVMDGDLLRQLRLSLTEESGPNKSDLVRLYAEAGVVLPDMIQRRFDEVESFHRTVISNRRSHLASEISSAEARIDGRDRSKANKDERRRQIMGILEAGGALDHYTKLHEELGRSEAELEGLRQRLETAEKLESTKAQLDIERARLSKALQDDIHERAEIIRSAILTFEELSESLYERAGSLTISDSHGGPTFDVRIDGQRSKGITNMQIFCFDLMLAEISTRQGRGPGFLIHDSHLFDGVDERQVAKALQLGAERAERAGFQYIVTMNSDALPRDGFTDGFDVGSYVLRTKLTDITDSGGLFGLRFS